MDNKKSRKETRRSLLIYLDCIDQESGNEAGKVVDITTEGFLLVSEAPPQLGSSAEYRIVLPKLEAFEGKEITAGGTCRWIRREDIQEFFYSGIQFDKPEDIDEELIELLINKIGFSDGQKKIFTAPSDVEYK